MIYSCLGWIYESLYCTVKDGKWENRGFLYGPACPIYGVGAVAISVIMSLAGGDTVKLEAWQVFVISVLGSAVLEYVTSWVLEKLFHAVWWDYSDLPLNLHGRISLLTSLGFGCGGLLVVYVIAPFTEDKVSYLSPLAMEILALFLTALFSADLTLTVSALLSFDKMVLRAEDTFNKNMEQLVETTVQKKDQLVESTVQKKEQIKQGIISRQRDLARLNDNLSSFAKGTVRRIRTFRYDNKIREKAGNSILSLIKRGDKGETSS